MSHPIVTDPNGHFPYKRDAAVTGHANENFDPENPHLGDAFFTVHPEIADACAKYVDSQAQYLENPNEMTHSWMNECARQLTQIRAVHAGDQTMSLPSGNASKGA